MTCCNLVQAASMMLKFKVTQCCEWRKACRCLRTVRLFKIQLNFSVGGGARHPVSCRKAEDGKNKAEKTVQELKDKMQAEKNATTESIQKKLDEALAAKAPSALISTMRERHGPSSKIKCIEFGSNFF